MYRALRRLSMLVLGGLALLGFPMIMVMALLTSDSFEGWKKDIKGIYIWLFTDELKMIDGVFVKESDLNDN